MGDIKQPQKVLAFAGLLYVPDANVNPALEGLEPYVGRVALKSEPQQFTHTTYYSQEMGNDLTRQWFVFDKLIEPDILIQLKHQTNALEKNELNERGGRRVNIDPGLLSMSNVVLASTKNYSHRIYCGKGIYAEVTLIYEKKTFKPTGWTYPDYREKSTVEFLCMARDILKEKLKGVQHV